MLQTTNVIALYPRLRLHPHFPTCAITISLCFSAEWLLPIACYCLQDRVSVTPSPFQCRPVRGLWGLALSLRIGMPMTPWEHRMTTSNISGATCMESDMGRLYYKELMRRENGELLGQEKLWWKQSPINPGTFMLYHQKSITKLCGSVPESIMLNCSQGLCGQLFRPTHSPRESFNFLCALFLW